MIEIDPPTTPQSDSEAAQASAQRAVDRAEAAATRRRWVTLAEIVGVVGLVIAALGLWLNWSDRRADEQAKRTEQASEAKVRTLVMLTATAENDGHRLRLKDPARTIQSVEVRFPTGLGVAKQTTMVEPKIEAGWFSSKLLELTDEGNDEREGRLPVLITARYWDGAEQRQDTAIYDLVWKTQGRLLQGRKFRLEGMLLRERSASPARLDTIWAQEKPRPAG